MPVHIPSVSVYNPKNISKIYIISDIKNTKIIISMGIPCIVKSLVNSNINIIENQLICLTLSEKLTDTCGTNIGLILHKKPPSSYEALL